VPRECDASEDAEQPLPAAEERPDLGPAPHHRHGSEYADRHGVAPERDRQRWRGGEGDQRAGRGHGDDRDRQGETGPRVRTEARGHDRTSSQVRTPTVASGGQRRQNRRHAEVEVATSARGHGRAGTARRACPETVCGHASVVNPGAMKGAVAWLTVGERPPYAVWCL
jgi:hypothetical protein